PMGVRAALHVAPVLALVHIRIDVSHDREGDLAWRLLEERDRADADHLVHGRRQRDDRAGHARDAWTPDAARDEHVLSVYRALVGVDPAHAVVLDVDAGDLGAREYARAAPLCVLAHQRSRP